ASPAAAGVKAAAQRHTRPVTPRPHPPRRPFDPRYAPGHPSPRSPDAGPPEPRASQLMVRYQPYWLDRFPKSRRPAYPKFRGEMDTGVVIVGGGLTGCACAGSFANAGGKTLVGPPAPICAGATS